MKYVSIGQVVSAHGIQGDLRFSYYSESEANLKRYGTLYAEVDGNKIELKPVSVRRQKKLFLIRFKGLESIEKVSFLLKKELFVAEADLPELDGDEYYDFQLMGMTVVNEEGEEIGRVDEVLHTKGGDILSIGGKTSLLVPLHEDFILHIDTANARIAVRERPFLG
ncbi:MAG TPA: 16S rRNA processing protein RimM [Deltaproteobacteria bacterium]|nr:16S rRNA processing protein RimM [Deltaproteobacteria bacterium]